MRWFGKGGKDPDKSAKDRQVGRYKQKISSKVAPDHFRQRYGGTQDANGAKKDGLILHQAHQPILQELSEFTQFLLVLALYLDGNHP